MRILAHRGYWEMNEEKNSIDALKKALCLGYGIETDIRDYKGKLVISHNVANANSPLLDDMLSAYADMNCKAPIALNIKADGLQELLKTLLKEYNIMNYFLFDMSIPELVINEKEKLNFFTRHSDIEPHCVMYDSAEGVWLDSFYESNWLGKEIIERHLQNGKKIGIISPEIHGFSHYGIWEILRENKYANSKNVYLCTDLPAEAEEYFNV